MRWMIVGLIVFALSAAPNLYWFSGSSIILRNDGQTSLAVRLALADNPDRLVELGEIAPGAGHFAWLHVSGEATLEVDVHDGNGWRRHCREYIEQSAYRVEVAIRSPRDVTCAAGLGAFHHLLIADYLSGL